MRDFQLDSSDPKANAVLRKAEDAERVYASPTLKIYGTVVEFTKGGGITTGDGGGNKKKGKSEPSLKENIVRIGQHPRGFGLYLFDYKPAFRASCGQGRQFGVMADEVERIVPAAVSMGQDGHRLVDYEKLGLAIPLG